jgi:hypothetical protein
MNTLPLHLLTAFAIASALPAQTKSAIYPRDHTNREGYSYNSIYHMTAGICRVQYSYEAWNLDLPKGAKITAFGYRQDGYSAVSTLKLQFEALMGHNTRLQEKLTGKFDTNYDMAPTKVIAKKIFNLPAMLKGSAPSKGFLMLKLDKPFTYVHPKNLVTEVKVFGNNNGNKNFYYNMDYARYYSPSKSFGLACKTSGGSFPILTSSSAVLQSSWTLGMSKFPASSASVLILGASKTKLFGSIPLPFKLDPLGMKGCYQNIDMNFIMAGPTTSTSGTGGIRFQVPLQFSLIGQKIYAQMWAADMFANSAGLVTSNGVEAQFGAHPREHLVYATGSTTRATGSRITNYGQVTRFDYQ